MNQVLKVFFAILLAITPAFSWSAVPSRISDFMTESMELNLQHIAHMDKVLKEHDRPIEIKNYIPLNMQATSSSRKVAAVLLSHSLNNAFNVDNIRNKNIGNAAGRVVNGMGTNMTWVEASGLIHKLNLKAKGTVASVTYKGYVKANLSYEAVDGKFDFEISKKISGDTRLVFNHIDDSIERSDKIGISWTW